MLAGMIVFVIPADELRIPLVSVEVECANGLAATLRELLGRLYAGTDVLIVRINVQAINAHYQRVSIARIWCPRWRSYQIDDEGIIRPLPEQYERSKMLEYPNNDLHQKLCDLRTK